MIRAGLFGALQEIKGDMDGSVIVRRAPAKK